MYAESFQCSDLRCEGEVIRPSYTFTGRFQLPRIAANWNAGSLSLTSTTPPLNFLSVTIAQRFGSVEKSFYIRATAFGNIGVEYFGWDLSKRNTIKIVCTDLEKCILEIKITLNPAFKKKLTNTRTRDANGSRDGGFGEYLLVAWLPSPIPHICHFFYTGNYDKCDKYKVCPLLPPCAFQPRVRVVSKQPPYGQITHSTFLCSSTPYYCGLMVSP